MLEPTLDRVVATHEQSLEDAMGRATDELNRQNSPNFELDPNKRIQAFSMARLVAEETALAQAIGGVDSFNPTTDTSPKN